MKNSHLPFKVSRDVNKSYVEQMVDGVREAIVGGYWRIGDPMPSLKDMAELPLEEAQFHGYWCDPHADVTKGVRTSLYTWRKDGRSGFVLAVCNTSREDLATGLKLDWAKAGTAPSALTDLVSGETKTEAEWSGFVLKSHFFLLLVPQGTK